MKNNYDVVVVGGGPGGSMAAWEAAKAGLSVCLLDRPRHIEKINDLKSLNVKIKLIEL